MEKVAEKRLTMQWNEEKNVVMAREIAASELFHHKSGSRERGLIWQSIADKLNALQDLTFIVTARSIRDRFTLLTRKHKAKTSKEVRSSGISVPDLTELEQLIEDLIQTSEESELKFLTATEERKKGQAADFEKAINICQTAMEKIGETRKRTLSSDDEFETKKVRRRSGSDAMDFLQEKLKNDKILQENKAEERAHAAKVHDDNMKANNEMLKTFQQSIVQQANQSNAMQQQVMAMMGQQNQTIRLMMKFMEKNSQ